MNFEEKNKKPSITASLFIFDYRVGFRLFCILCAQYRSCSSFFSVVLVYNLKPYFEFMPFKSSDVCITCVIYTIYNIGNYLFIFTEHFFGCMAQD